MKCLHLLAAVVALAVVPAAHAQTNPWNNSARPFRMVSGGGPAMMAEPYIDANADYGIPAVGGNCGGMGFMGSCCHDHVSPCTKGLWKGFCPHQCHEKSGSSFSHWRGQMLGLLHGGCSHGCNRGCGGSYCGGPGANYWGHDPCCVPTCCKIHNLLHRGYGLMGIGGTCGATDCGCGSSKFESDKFIDADVKAGEYYHGPVDQIAPPNALPAREPNGEDEPVILDHAADYTDTPLPLLVPNDRSAAREPMRRLPVTTINY